jgi:hypothetical protein
MLWLVKADSVPCSLFLLPEPHQTSTAETPPCSLAHHSFKVNKVAELLCLFSSEFQPPALLRNVVDTKGVIRPTFPVRPGVRDIENHSD